MALDDDLLYSLDIYFFCSAELALEAAHAALDAGITVVSFFIETNVILYFF